jgi:uncharacterized protein YcbK (DUF882 family)
VAVTIPRFSRTLQITPHFAISEFISPNDPWGWAYLEQNWAKFYPRLLKLCGVLEKIRAAFGGIPLHLTSGLRSPAHNARIGGAKASQHLECTAVDFYIEGIGMGRIVAYAEKIPEVGGLATKPGAFVHVDVRARWFGQIVRWTY